jgi:hypothetical protein
MRCLSARTPNGHPCRDAVAITARTIQVSNSQYGLILSEGAIRYTPIMSGALIGYACCSTDAQALTAQRQRLAELGVADRISLDHGLTAAKSHAARTPPSVRGGPGRRHARDAGARSAHPFRARCPIDDERAARDIRLSLGGGNPWCPARMTMHTNADSCYGSKTRFSA